MSRLSDRPDEAEQAVRTAPILVIGCHAAPFRQEPPLPASR